MQLSEGAAFTTSIYAYPWALVDEGFDISLGRIADLAGCEEILLTPCYHHGDYFLPHHPLHPVYFGEPGAIYFRLTCRATRARASSRSSATR